MTGELTGFKIKAIGIVRNAVKQPMKNGWEKVTSDIVVNSNLTQALDGIEDFSHIVVLFWMHKVADTGSLPLKVHPMGKSELPLVGLFATRSPHRPNPVGETTVKLLQRQDNILKVEGLDAIDGTPVVDIKPYIHQHNLATNTRMPSWITRE